MKQFTGKVINLKNQKTATVLIERLWQEPMYKKRIKRSKKFLADNQIGVKHGDKVIIIECRPLGKRKRFQIIKIIKQS